MTTEEVPKNMFAHQIDLVSDLACTDRLTVDSILVLQYYQSRKYNIIIPVHNLIEFVFIVISISEAPFLQNQSSHNKISPAHLLAELDRNTGKKLCVINTPLSARLLRTAAGTSLVHLVLGLLGSAGNSLGDLLLSLLRGSLGLLSLGLDLIS